MLPQYDPRYWIFGAMNCKVLHHLDKLTTAITVDQCPELHLRLSTGQPKHIFNALLDLEVQTPYLHTLTAVECEALRLAVAAYKEGLGRPELHQVYLDKLALFEELS